MLGASGVSSAGRKKGCRYANAQLQIMHEAIMKMAIQLEIAQNAAALADRESAFDLEDIAALLQKVRRRAGGAGNEV